MTEWKAFEPTADLCDRLGSKARVCELPLIAYGARREAAGTIACIKVGEDAAPVRRLLGQPGQGRILIVDGGGSRRVALLGERMARLGLENGWAGVIVHGAIRDVAALRAVEFAVFALCAVPRKAAGGGVLQEEEGPVNFGGVTFKPGESVHVDLDGLVITKEPR